MKKIAWVIKGLWLLSLILGSAVFAQDTSLPDNAGFQFPIMRPDPVTLQKWMEDYEKAPGAEMDPAIHLYLLEAESLGVTTSLNLLNHIQYTPNERNQGGCGNCWVWASTGVMEIALDVQNSVHDRLSTQFLDSCKTDSYACCGGNLSMFSNWYASTGYAIPWSNTSASFQDGSSSYSCPSASGSSNVPCGSISTTPNYPITSISPTTISTTGYSGDATPIANIKNILNQGKGVYFAFWLANQTDWNGFYSFWGGQPETTIWDPDVYCGHTWVNGEGGGHAVLIVGYDDSSTDPTQQYWIVLNSWGTTSGRPNGLFRMKMHMNYNCTLAGISGYVRQFQTLNVAFNSPAQWNFLPGSTPSAPALAWHPGVNKLFLAVRAANDSIWVSTFNSSGAFNNDWTWIPGATPSSPALAWNPGASELQMVVRGSDNSIWVSTFDARGAFNNDWTRIPGATPSPPALDWNPGANELQIVVRADNNSLWAGTFNSTGVFNNDWTWISGMTPSAPALAWNSGANKLQMVVRAADDSAWVSSFNSAGAFNNDWALTPGRTVETPALAWDGLESNLGMIVRAADSSIWFSTFGPTGAFNNDWVNIPGTTASPPGVAYLSSVGYLGIVVRAADGSLWRMLY